MDRLDRFWVGASFVLFLVAVAGLAAFLYRRDAVPPIPITSQPGLAFYADIQIDGAVTNPGLYPLKHGDTVDDLLAAAGGLTPSADEGYLHLDVPLASKRSQAQKVDVNRAEAWLLQVLPGIGPDKARAIGEYRGSHGPFRAAEDLLRVPGIGEATLEAIKPFITMGE
ncbi:MAG: ComEA family DNA-binding protein [Chloroflexi bacterium]|nr:ComEA family DNA-binding protein [Chloroflexota bacterium]